MRISKKLVAGAVGLAVAGLVAAMSGAIPVSAESVFKPLMAVIINDTSSPVPVTVMQPVAIDTSVPLSVTFPKPQSVQLPLWQGRPFAAVAAFTASPDAGGFEQCKEAFKADDGNVVLVNTIAGSFSVKPGSFGGMRAVLVMPDGKPLFVTIPTSRTASAIRVPATFDRFAGSLTLSGFPVIGATTCVLGLQAEIDMEFLGFTVPLPQ